MLRRALHHTVYFLFLLRREPAANNIYRKCKPKQVESSRSESGGWGSGISHPHKGHPALRLPFLFNTRLLYPCSADHSKSGSREGLLNREQQQEHLPASLLRLKAGCNLHTNREPSHRQSKAIPLLAARFVSPTYPPPRRKHTLWNKLTSKWTTWNGGCVRLVGLPLYNSTYLVHSNRTTFTRIRSQATDKAIPPLSVRFDSPTYPPPYAEKHMAQTYQQTNYINQPWVYTFGGPSCKTAATWFI